MTRIEEMTVYGKVFQNGRTYFLLNKTPSRSGYVWKPSGSLQWLAASVDDQEEKFFNSGTLENPKWRIVCPVVDLIFGSSATIQLHNTPSQTVLVRVEVIEEEIEGSPV